MTIDNNINEHNYGLSLSLVLYGLKIHPDKATDLLGIYPTSSRAIGEAGRILGKK